MKLNRKGYLTVEIILASTIAFAIAFFLIEITVKLVSKTDDIYRDTIIKGYGGYRELFKEKVVTFPPLPK